MTRPHRPGSILDALSGALDAAGRKAVAADLGISISALSRHCDADEDNGRPMHIGRLDLLCRMSAPAAAVMARHFAALAGGAYVPPGGATASLHAAVAGASAAAGGLSVAMIEAADPSGPGGADLTADELRDLADRAEAAQDAARATLVAARAALAAAEGRG